MYQPPHEHDGCPIRPVMNYAAKDGAPGYEVTQFTFSGSDTDSEFVIMCRGRRIIIRLTENQFSESSHLRDHYLFFLRVADEGDLDGYEVEDFYDWVMEPFLPLLRSIPSRNTGDSAIPTLQDYFFPETWVYTLNIVAGKLSPTQCETTSADTDWIRFGIFLPEELCTSWQCFQPSEIQICAETPDEALTWQPRKVQPVGETTPYFLKYLRAGDQNAAKRELTAYKRIREVITDPEVRVSRLRGLVQDGKGVICGLLLTYINCRAKTLAGAVKPHIPVALKRKWKSQISSTVHLLHEAGVIWGDVKADNVLVDDKDDAWIVDFGGGYTEGWVEKQSTGTLAGDMDGLAKVLKYIGD